MIYLTPNIFRQWSSLHIMFLISCCYWVLSMPWFNCSSKIWESRGFHPWWAPTPQLPSGSTTAGCNTQWAQSRYAFRESRTFVTYGTHTKQHPQRHQVDNILIVSGSFLTERRSLKQEDEDGDSIMGKQVEVEAKRSARGGFKFTDWDHMALSFDICIYYYPLYNISIFF